LPQATATEPATATKQATNRVAIATDSPLIYVNAERKKEAMSKGEQKVGICPECKVRESDSSKKTLYQCRFCERWFCFRHLDQKLAVFRDFKKPIKDRRLQDMIEEDWKRRDGHPDFQYTLDRLKEYEVEKRIDRKIIIDLLNRSKAYGKRKPKKRIREGELYFVKEDEDKIETIRETSGKGYSRKRRFSISVKELVLYSIVFIVGLFLFLYSARNVYLIFSIPFIPFPIPLWIFGIAAMIIGALGLVSSMY
jgi:hypothetical protein